MFFKFLVERIADPLVHIAAGWVSADVRHEGERLAQARLMRTLLIGALGLLVCAAPLLAALVPARIAMPFAVPGAVAVAAGCLIVAAALNLSASRAKAGILALVLATLAAIWLVLRTGGAASPVLPVLAVMALAAGIWRSGNGSGVVADAPAAQEASNAAVGTRQDVLDHMPGLVTLHDVKGHVTRFGGLDAAAFSEWMRAPGGRGFLDQIHVSDRLKFLQAFDRLRQGAAREMLEIRLTRKGTLGDASGAQFTEIAAELVALRDAAGGLLEVVVQSRVAAEMAELRRDLATMAAKAASADAEKTRFLAAVSHEMRTPLNAIIGFSEILSREYFGTLTDQRQRDYVVLIRQSGEHLLALVNTMLDMSKIEAGHYRLIGEPFDVAPVVEESCAMLALAAEEKGLALTVRITRNCGPLHADRRAVQQVLINLIGNAIKFTERGGVVTVDAERRGTAVRLTVGDTGIGMAPAVLERLGQPFVQAEDDYDRRHQGTGLGLCLVKGLVALHGGHFAVDSQPGRGTAVTIDLPADGSGIDRHANEAGKRTIEFPPRLRAFPGELQFSSPAGDAVHAKQMEYGPLAEDEKHDATAKTA